MRIKKLVAFTLIELLKVMAIIAFLAAMWLPAWSRAKERSVRISYVNNLKQVGVRLAIHCPDYSDKLPTRVWYQVIVPHQGYFLFAVSAAQNNYPSVGTAGQAVDTTTCPGVNHGHSVMTDRHSVYRTLTHRLGNELAGT